MQIPETMQAKESIHSKKQKFVRGELCSAAMDIFYTVGFDETTIDQIAVRANVSRRTFFRYFSSKEDVMAVTMTGYGAALIDALHDQPKEASLFEAAKAVVKSVATLGVNSPDSRKILEISKRSPAARSAQLLQMPVIEDQLAEAFALRDKAQSGVRIPYVLLASVTLSATSLCIRTRLETDDHHIDDLVDQAFSTLVKVFSPRPRLVSKSV